MRLSVFVAATFAAILQMGSLGLAEEAICEAENRLEGIGQRMKSMTEARDVIDAKYEGQLSAKMDELAELNDWSDEDRKQFTLKWVASLLGEAWQKRGPATEELLNILMSKPKDQEDLSKEKCEEAIVVLAKIDVIYQDYEEEWQSGLAWLDEEIKKAKASKS